MREEGTGARGKGSKQVEVGGELEGAEEIEGGRTRWSWRESEQELGRRK